MRKLIFLFAFISTFIFGQTPDGSRKAWTDTLKISRNNQFVDIMTIISDSSLSADGVTVLRDGTFKQKVFSDTTALKLASADSVGMVVVVKTSLYAGDYAYYVYADSTFPEGKFAFGASTTGKQWIRLTPYVSATSPTSAPKGQMYFNTTDSTLKIYNGNSFDQIYSNRDRIGGDEFTNPLEIPTFDGNPSTTHLSVVFRPEGWNGYRYWMGHTPYPSASRENPEIVASNNGVKWVEPKGISNPIAPLSDVTGLGYTAQSDNDLMFKGDTLMVFYRSMYSGIDAQETVWMRWSVNGVDWSDTTRILSSGIDTAQDTLNYWLSPSLLNFGDTLFYMYCVTDTGTGWDGDYRLTRWTSTNARDWSFDQYCDYGRSVSSNLALWHMDIVYENGVYYMLGLDILDGYRYLWYKSTDGINWSVQSTTFKLSGLSADDGYNYRGTLLAVPGNPISFKVWAVGVANNGGTVFTSTHRAMFYDNITLSDIEGSSNSYAEAYFQNLDTLQTVSTQFTWYQIKAGYSAGYMSGWTLSGDTLYCSAPGKYIVSGHISMKGTSGESWQSRVSTNRFTAGDHTPRFYAAGNYVSVPITGIINFLDGDWAVVQVRNLSNTNDFTVHGVTIVLQKIAD